MLVEIDDQGRAVRVKGDPAHAFTHGGLCVKVAHYERRTYHPERLRYPMRRVGRKGEGKFERISWDEALDTTAAKLKSIASDNPESILPYSYAGTMGLLQGASMDRRFFHRLGASLLDRTICSAAGMFGMRYSVGASVGTNPETVDRAKYILIWGSNVITSNLHLWRYILKARSHGAKIVTIDPLLTKTGEQSDEHNATPAGQRGHRFGKIVATHQLESQIGAQPRGELSDLRLKMRRRLASKDWVGKAELFRAPIQLRCGARSAQHHTAERRSNLYRGSSHSAAYRVDQQALTGAKLALEDQRVKGGEERLRQCGGLGEVHRIGNRHALALVGNHPLRECAASDEAHHPIAASPARNPRSQGGDPARVLEPGDIHRGAWRRRVQS